MELNSENYFRQILSPEQFRVMRQKGTETPHTGRYWDSEEQGVYVCAACSSILFLSLNKIRSETGWPEFTRPANKQAVDFAGKNGKTTVFCKRCESHLGIIVPRDGKKLYQINSIALDFKELPDIEWEEDDGSQQDQAQNQQQQQSRKPKTLSLTIGGLTIGAALGAGVMWASTPPAPLCTPSAAELSPIDASSSTLPAISPSSSPLSPVTTPKPKSTPIKSGAVSPTPPPPSPIPPTIPATSSASSAATSSGGGTI